MNGIIENECYLALNKSQLNRVDLPFRSGDEIEMISSDDYYSDRVYILKAYMSPLGRTTGEGIYLSINKHYLDLDNVTFLFKLKEI